jgi:hypothetical protein
VKVPHSFSSSSLKLNGWQNGVTPIVERQYDAANHANGGNLAKRKSSSQHTTTLRMSVPDAMRMLEGMLSTHGDGSLKERQALVSRFVEQVVVYPDHAEIHFSFRSDNGTQIIRHDWSQQDSPQKMDSWFRSPRQAFGWRPTPARSIGRPNGVGMAEAIGQSIPQFTRGMRKQQRRTVFSRARD